MTLPGTVDTANDTGVAIGTRILKKLAILIGVIFVLAIATFASLPMLLSSEAAQQRIITHFEELTGRKVSFRGDPKISFRPFLGIEVSDFTIAGNANAGSAAPLLSVEKVTGSIDWLPALFGKVQLSQYNLFRPVLTLNQRRDGTTSWQFDKGLVRDAFESNASILSNGETSAETIAQLGRLEITDGAIVYTDEISGDEERISGVNASINWPDTASAIIIGGQGVWRNENVSFTLNSNKPMQLLAGGDTTLNSSVKSEPLNLVFNGEAKLLPDLFLKGKLDATSPSIARLSQVMDIDIGETSIIGDWRTSGDLEATSQSWVLGNATIGIDQNEATGVVRLANTEIGALKIDGTLAFGAIDISSYFTGDRLEAADVISRDRTTDIDLDLRISAEQLTAGQISLEKLASAITLNQGNWKLDISDATLFDNSVSARLESVKGETSNAISLKVTADNMPMAELASLFGEGKLGIAGRGKINADLRTTTPLPDLRSLAVNGSAEVEISDGEVTGIDLPSLLTPDENGERTQFTSIVLDENAVTPFSNFAIKLFLNNSNATISQANLSTSSGQEIQFLGNVDFQTGSLAMRALEKTGSSPKPERLMIGGTIGSPFLSLTIDPNARPAVEETPAPDDENNG